MRTNLDLEIKSLLVLVNDLSKFEVVEGGERCPQRLCASLHFRLKNIKAPHNRIERQKDKCKLRYIGQTQRQLKYRLAEHRGYINNHVETVSTGAHFNLPGHSQADLKITVIEQAKKKDKTYREIREEYHINKFYTYYEGLNRKQ